MEQFWRVFLSCFYKGAKELGMAIFPSKKELRSYPKLPKNSLVFVGVELAVLGTIFGAIFGSEANGPLRGVVLGPFLDSLLG